MKEILIYNEFLQVNSVPNPVSDPLTGEQVLRLAGADDPKNYIVLQWLPDGDLEYLRLDERSRSDESSQQRFILFRSASTYMFEIDGRRLQWGKPQIRGDVLKKLVGENPEFYGVWQQGKPGEDDRLIANDHFADLKSEGLEVFFTAAKESTEGGRV